MARRQNDALQKKVISAIYHGSNLFEADSLETVF